MVPFDFDESTDIGNMGDGQKASALPWGLGPGSGETDVCPSRPARWGAYQLQWDYQIEWPCAETPKITLLRYRSYQHNRVTDKSELVEEISENIPVNAQIMLGISQHAAGYLFAHADLEGNWWFVDRTFFVGCAEAAKKRFSLKTFREMNQRNPNPRF